MAELVIDIEKLRYNINYISKYIASNNLELVGVLKGIHAFPDIIQEFLKGGIAKIGISRFEIARQAFIHFGVKPMCITLPSIHQTKEVINLFSSSLNSEIETIKALGQTAKERSLTHDIILMVDVGDLREGIMPENICKIVEEILNIKNSGLKINGIGSNWGCCSGLLPDKDNLMILPSLADDIESRFGIEIETVSVGGSILLEWMKHNELPEKMNQIRIGEAIILGNIPTINRIDKDLYQDVFMIKSELLEVKEKPSFPKGETGFNAFGKKLSLKNKGIRKRAIVNFGAVDTNPAEINSVHDNVDIITFNTDYTVIDVSDCQTKFKAGDSMLFSLNYNSLTHSLMSPFTTIKLADKNG